MGEVTIGDSDLLYRRLFYTNVNAPHSKRRAGEVNSTAYIEYDDPLQRISVELAKLTTLEDCMSRGEPGQGVGVLRVGDVRALGLRVEHTPEDGDTEAHCDILPGEGKTIESPDCKNLSRKTKVKVAPQRPPGM